MEQGKEENEWLEEYYWNKHGRPESDYLRHRLVEYCLSYLKIRSFVVKSYHVEENEECWGKKKQKVMNNTLLSKDLAPFVVYSNNKMRRWEDQNNVGPDMIDDLREFHDGTDVVILERNYLECMDGLYGLLKQQWIRHYKINAFHRLEDSEGEKPTYRKYTAGGRGHTYPTILSNIKASDMNSSCKSEEADVTVAYNYFKAPNNYKQLRVKQYTPSNYGWHWPRSGYWRRLERAKCTKNYLQYVEQEYELTVDEDTFEEEEELVDSGKVENPSSYYDLSEHFVEKFVFVKNVNDFVIVDCSI